MFQTGELLKYNFTNQNQYIGLICYNPHINFKLNYTRPFVRNGVRELVNIGRINYAVLDDFIMQSLTSYYNTIETQKKQEEKNKIIAEYQQLYYLWQTICTAKQNNDANITSYYDDLIYRLYILGYKQIKNEPQS